MTASTRFADLSYRIIGCAMKVHRRLGPGLLESVYSKCLAHELRKLGFHVATEVSLPIRYDDLVIADAYRVDQIVEHDFVVELKAVGRVTPIDYAQTRTYVRLTGWQEGLLLNFNVLRLVDGVHHILAPDHQMPSISQGIQ